jgi:hypothetical protein
LLAFAGVEFAAMPRAEISEAAAPVTRAVEKTRLFIIMICTPSRIGGIVWVHTVGIYRVPIFQHCGQMMQKDNGDA